MGGTGDRLQVRSPTRFPGFRRRFARKSVITLAWLRMLAKT